MISKNSPVFIHAMWRTGSTYIWKKFREHSVYRAYYEPLRERAFTSAPDNDLPDSAAITKRAASLRHPEVSGNYGDAYPRRSDAGGLQFTKSLSYERYHLDEDDSDPELQRYISHLIAFAAGKGETPVFKFNRSLLRSRWLARAFPSRNLLLLRRPIDTWRSCTDRELNLFHYFPTMLCLIVGQNRTSRLLGPIADAHGIPFYRSEKVEDEAMFYHSYALAHLSELYPVFYSFYLLTCLYNIGNADCVMDMDAITQSATARVAVGARLREIGIEMDFEDIAMPGTPTLSPEELEWLRYERQGIEFISKILPEQFRVPKSVADRDTNMISEYFAGVYQTFLQRSDEHAYARA